MSASSSAVVGDDKASDGDVESQGSNDDSLSSDAQDVDDLQNDLDLLSDEEGVEEWGEVGVSYTDEGLLGDSAMRLNFV